MKFKTLAFTVSVSLVSMFSTTSVQADDQLAQSLCNFVAANDKNGVRGKLKETRVKLRNIYDAVVCNGNNLVRHAMASNADDAGAYIVSQLPKSKLAEDGDVDWANSNGHGGSAVVAAIKERAGI